MRSGQLQVALAFWCGGQQLPDPAVKGDELRAVTNGQGQQVCVGDLPVSEKAAGATTQHLFKAKVQSQKAMLWMGGVSQ